MPERSNNPQIDPNDGLPAPSGPAEWLMRGFEAFRARRARKGPVPGYAVDLLWLLVGPGDVPEAIASDRGCDLFAICGAADDDNRDLIVALGRSETTQPNAVPLAWAVAATEPGAWMGAFRLADGRYWTIVVESGLLLPGPASDRLHADAEAARAALQAELAVAATQGQPVGVCLVSESIGLSGVEERPDRLDLVIKRAIAKRRNGSRLRLGTGGKAVRLRHTSRREAVKRRLSVGAFAVAGLGAFWFLWANVLTNPDSLRAAAPPPPPPPPPPPWMLPVPHPAASSFAAICERGARVLRVEIAGWDLTQIECDNFDVRGRWRRRPGLEPFNTPESFERQWTRLSLPGARQIVSPGDEIVMRFAAATPIERAGLARVSPTLDYDTISARFLTLQQTQGAAGGISPAAALPPRPNDRVTYRSMRFTSSARPDQTLGEWAARFDIPGLSIRAATWRAATRMWGVEGEIYERSAPK